MAAKEKSMQNMPDVKIGLIAVSRDCFPASLSEARRTKVAGICSMRKLPVIELKTIVEAEQDIPAALDEINNSGINALVLYLGNFGPEGPASLLVQGFGGPVMIAAAAEESSGNLMDGRGDAYCGMLSLSYNFGLRGLKPYIPEYPMGEPEEIADMIAEFIPVSRIHIGLKNLKIFTFGPRPHDFLTCNAPIKPLYDLGVEIMENSELDLLKCYQDAEGSPGIKAIVKDMSKELGGNPYPDLLPRLAQYELALSQFVRDNLGVCSWGVMANKCWPAFEKYFGFVPCYVNSRLASQGMPVACETDVYGALSEYMAMCATDLPATILDINNTVPADMISGSKKVIKNYRMTDLFMGFHCGNTPYACMAGAKLTHHFLMNRLIENGKEPDTTRGVLQGALRPGDVTVFRLQSTADTMLKAYIAEGEVLDVNPRSFGGTGVFAVSGMARFYRHVLIEHKFPHHTAVAFSHAGRPLFSALKMLGISGIFYNLPQGVRYPSENPFQK